MWQIKAGSKAKKQIEKLPKSVRDAFYLLLADLTAYGPEATRWTNYGKIRGKEDMHHCHLNKGKPRYVAVWKVTDREIRLMEVRYVGTHENADYKRIN